MHKRSDSRPGDEAADLLVSWCCSIGNIVLGLVGLLIGW